MKMSHEPHEPDAAVAEAPVADVPASDAPAPEAETPEQSAAYDRLIRAAHAEWSALEQAGDPEVTVSSGVLTAIKRAVRAEVRHGSQVEVPPTRRGPVTVSERTLHTVLRRAVDSVPDVRSLRTALEYGEADGHGGRGRPTSVRVRISLALGTGLIAERAEAVRRAVDEALRRELGIDSVRIDVHIEDLHEQ